MRRVDGVVEVVEVVVVGLAATRVED